MHISPAHPRLRACRPGTNDVLHGGAKAEGQDVDAILFASAGARPTIDLQICIYCHPNISFHANVPTTNNRGTCLRTGILLGTPTRRVAYLAGAGSSATNRSETVSSSNWKWGRRKATAR